MKIQGEDGQISFPQRIHHNFSFFEWKNRLKMPTETVILTSNNRICEMENNCMYNNSGLTELFSS